jgi:plasmid replication initiation protein/predicted DNA-binding transcriptional regulator AlpA
MPDPNAGLPPRYLRTPEAARFLSLSGRTLEKHRTYGTGPAYRKIGGRVVYALDDLKAWADRGTKTSTSDPAHSIRRQVAALTQAECNVSASRRHRSERDQLDLFRALPGDLAPRDAQDLMAYPFFSLAKSKRITPIDFRAGTIIIRVEAVPEHGMATIWDADVLIWAASQIVEARDAGLKTSRLMAATPYEILTFVGRGTSVRDYDRLKAALDRLQSTTVMTSIRQPTERRRHRFSWINEWKETADVHGNARGLELILPDWFYTGVLNEALVLTIDRAYFDLTGGLERWLYRLVRKHGGRQEGGWSFDLVHLHAKSGSLSPLKHFAYDLREIVHRQTLPGYRLVITHDPRGVERLNFAPVLIDAFAERLRKRGLVPPSGGNL